MRYATLIPCGPSPLEIERITDLVDALRRHDPEECMVALVLNDGNADVASLSAPNLRIVDNPRAGEGWGWGGGLIGGQLWAWDLIAREYPDAGCIVKLDTDALPIRPLGAALGTIFDKPGVGMAGSRIGLEPFPPYKTTNPWSYFANKVRKLRAPISLWRKPRWHLRFAVTGAHRWIASLYTQAERHGYLPGELIEGGAFATGTACIRELVRAGVTRRWRDFLDAPVSDDVVLSMLPYTVGYRAVEAALFSVEPASLRHAPEQLLADPAVGVIHSLKGYNGLSERELREVFRAARSGR